MDIPIKSNMEQSPYTMLGNGMILFGILGIISTVLNVALPLFFRENVYQSEPTVEWLLYYILIIINLLMITIAEVKIIVIFLKIAKFTPVPVFKQLAIIHIIYIVYMIAYTLLLPWVVRIFYIDPIGDIQSIFFIDRIGSIGLLVILLLSDGFLYQFCMKVLHQYPLKMAFIIYLPLFLMAFRLIRFLIGFIPSNFLISLVFAGFAIIIPAFWILLGNNFKSIAPPSENTV